MEFAEFAWWVALPVFAVMAAFYLFLFLCSVLIALLLTWCERLRSAWTVRPRGLGLQRQSDGIYRKR